MPTLRYERVQTSALNVLDGNPRIGVTDAIADSLVKHGQYKPIVVNIGKATGRPMEVLAGNHTLMAARSLGWEAIEVVLVDVDDQTAKSIALADNHLADMGGYDEHALLELLRSVEDLDGTGYLLEDLAQLERDLYPPQPHTDPDAVPPVPVDPISKAGQVWQLGPHRLLIGDATDTDAVKAAVGDMTPDVVWTDPPYGVEYVGKTKNALRIQNDGATGLAVLLEAAFTTVAQVCRPGAPVYVAHADTERITFEASMLNAGLLVRQNLIWAKNSMVMGRSDYHYEHEPILYGFVPAKKGRLGRGGDNWFGDNKQTTVFHIDRPSRNEDHPTMKPVELINAMLANSLRPGGTVFDPFAGSGSTLIAAHGRGARAVCVELDPRYADVILRRFEAHTAVVPELQGHGPVSLIETAEL